MKILFIAPSNSVHAVRWIERASNSGIQCLLFDLAPENQRQVIEDVETFALPDTFFSRKKYFQVIYDVMSIFKSYALIRNILKQRSPDFIHAHWLFSGVPFAASFFKSVPLIITPWGSDIQVPIFPLKGRIKFVLTNRIFTRRIASHCSMACCDSVAQREILVARGAKKTEVNIIYFGTDVEKFAPSNRDSSIREKFGASDEDLLVISNRNHEDVYDIPTFLKAAALVAQRSKNIRFVIAGSGSLTTNLKKIVSDLKIEDRIYFTGRMTDHEFVCATASCDIYVSTSKSDGGLSASVAEAMASSVPVLISNFGENASWLKKNTAGYAFEIGDSENLAEKIIELANNADLRKKMGSEGRKIIAAENNSKLEWVKVLDMYQRVLVTR
jgi:glycosyltransferase involved in cell wall biosynthesis